MYHSPIPLSHMKWKHLQEIKATIEKHNHAFYDSLPYKSATKDKKGKQ